MRPVSERFLNALRGSHRATSQALAVDNGQNGVEPGNATELSIISGDVRFDGQAQIRSALTLEVEGTGLFPRPGRRFDRLAPYRTEIYVRRGLDYGGGQVEYVGLGYYRVDSVEQDEAPDGPIRISASDRMAGIIDARLTSPQQFDGTWTYGQVVHSLAVSANSFAIVVEWDDTAVRDTPLGRTVLAEEDRYGFLNELITSLGKIWYWDHRGYLVVKDPPSADVPVWEVNSGAGGVLVQLARDLSREGVYNGVVATGEAFDTEAPVRALAVDGNFESPTWWYGGFGKVPRFYSSPFITTTAQARSAAESILRQNLGVPYAVDFSNIPNPALEVWDPIQITLHRRAETHIIETLVLPLSPLQAQTGTTREQTTIEIGEA